MWFYGYGITYQYILIPNDYILLKYGSSFGWWELYEMYEYFSFNKDNPVNTYFIEPKINLEFGKIIYLNIGVSAFIGTSVLPNYNIGLSIIF